MILNKMKILAIRAILIHRSETFIVIVFIYAKVLLLLLKGDIRKLGYHTSNLVKP